MKKLVYKNSRAYKLHTTGVMSYARNFNNIIFPELSKHVNITDNYIHGDIVLSVSDNISFYNRPGSDKQKRTQRVVQILHIPDWLKIEGFINSDKHRPVYRKMITHYKKLIKNFESQDIVDYAFIPMSIDTAMLPVNTNKNKKFIWFGNVTSLKLETYDKLRHLFKFDTLSKGKLNSSLDVKTNIESLKIVSQYKYVFAVGQCALEALAMGCKVIMIGKHFSGAITNDNYKENWHMSNMNSEYKSIDLTTESLQKEIEKAEIVDNFEQFDMRNFTNNYIQEIINIDLQ